MINNMLFFRKMSVFRQKSAFLAVIWRENWNELRWFCGAEVLRNLRLHISQKLRFENREKFT